MAERAPSLRAQKMAERRARILASARELIAEGGFEALTTRALAERAKVTVPTIYNLVGSKDEVLFEAVEEQTQRFLASIGDRSGRSPLEQVVAVGDDCVAELLRDPRYYAALLRLMHASDSARGTRRAVGFTVAREFEHGVGALRDQGALRDGIAPRPLAERLAALLTAAAMQWAVGDLDAEGFRRTSRLGTHLLLLGVVEGPTRDQLEEAIREESSPGTSGPRADPERSEREKTR